MSAGRVNGVWVREVDGGDEGVDGGGGEEGGGGIEGRGRLPARGGTGSLLGREGGRLNGEDAGEGREVVGAGWGDGEKERDGGVDGENEGDGEGDGENENEGLGDGENEREGEGDGEAGTWKNLEGLTEFSWN